MELQQLLGFYRRLKSELTVALEQLPRQQDLAQRLAIDLAAARQALRQAGATKEQLGPGSLPETQFGAENASHEDRMPRR